MFCLATGYLIYRSGFLPRALGMLMVIAGVCYLVNSYAVFLAPAFAALLFPHILLPCLMAELSLALWLAVRGVDVARWQRLRGGPIRGRSGRPWAATDRQPRPGGRIVAARFILQRTFEHEELDPAGTFDARAAWHVGHAPKMHALSD